MTDHPSAPTNPTVLTQVYEGMTVYDRDGSKLGTVKDVYLGEVTGAEQARGLGPATASPPGRSDTSLIDDFIKAVAPQEPVPEPIRQRLLRHGFIRIDSSGLFASDRYAMPDQIRNVSQDGVHLDVTRDDLIKR